MAGPDGATVDRIAARVLALPPASPRLRIAIAGPPGAGKSTFAAALVERLGPEAALVPMDGFHLDNAILSARGLLSRKGAPETFDALGVVRMVERLGADDEVVIPGFDRARDIAIAGAAVVGPDCRIAVVEGNYLLLGQAPWARLGPLWDLSVMISPPEAVLETRLVRRWIDHGLSHADATARAQGNDIPNARTVLSLSGAADEVLGDFAP
jgi:pantothenate kinase